MKRAKSRARNNSERGNTLIEANAITLLMFGLLFLIIDLSLALFTKATLQAAVQAGVRFAVTDRLAANQNYMNDSIVQVVQQNSLGLLNGGSGACQISVNYYNPITGQASTGTGGDVVEVSVQGYAYTPVGILKSNSPVSISASASDVLEQCPLGGCPAIANPNPPACP